MAISAQHTRFVTNDYISPIPAEDLIKVALKKQEMYDEGRKQIKEVYDNYGKLRATIKNQNELNYYDQEMQKLHKNVQQNAGLDFSNIGNVEAVINLAKPFENDEYIKTALENGQEIERRQRELASMAKDKRSADNDLVYMYDAQKHMESGGLGEKIEKNKSYQQYVDIRAKIMEIEKSIPAEEFTTYAEGPAGYLQEIEHKRKRRQDIYQRAMDGMSAEEKAQLQIHAQANMLRLGNDVIYQNWVGYNKEEKLLADQKRKEAMQELGRLNSIPKKTAKNLDDISALQNAVNSYESTITAANQNINMNPDDFDMGEYLPFFMTRQIDGIAGQLAFDNSKTELKENKVYMAQLDHNYKLAEIKAQGVEARATKQFEQSLDYTTESGASSNLLKGVSNYITTPITSKGSAAIGEAITQIDANTKITAARKQQLKDQLTAVQEVYKQAEASKTKGDMVVTINRGLPGEYTTGLNDFLTSNPIDLVSSASINKIEVRKKSSTTKGNKTAAQLQEEEKAKATGQLEAKSELYKNNPDFAKLLWGSSGSNSSYSALLEEAKKQRAAAKQQETDAEAEAD